MEFLIIWLIFAVACAIIANNKGRSGIGWFFLGLVFGIFALIVVAVLSPIGEQRAITRERDVLAKVFSRPCPLCHERILKEATKCKHCGSEVTPLSDADAPIVYASNGNWYCGVCSTPDKGVLALKASNRCPRCKGEKEAVALRSWETIS